jgi:hypothetical protein
MQRRAANITHVASSARRCYSLGQRLFTIAVRGAHKLQVHSANDMLDSITVIWIGFGILAAFMLVKMMRRRQLYLIDLLKKHVEIQAAWSRRRERAAQIAAAEQAETEKKKAKVVKIVNELTSQSSEAA